MRSQLVELKHIPGLPAHDPARAAREEFILNDSPHETPPTQFSGTCAGEYAVRTQNFLPNGVCVLYFSSDTVKAQRCKS